MKRLLKSSLFWTGVIGSIFLVVGYKLTDSELVATGILTLFGIRSLATGSSDLVRANRDVTFDEERGIDIKIQ